MDNKNWTIIKVILINVFIPFLLGFGTGKIIRVMLDNKEKKQITRTISGYESQFSNIRLELDNAKADTVKTGGTDQAVNDVILRTYTLSEQIYKMSVDKRLLHYDKDLFMRNLNLLNSIYDWQQNQERTRVNFISGTGLSSIYVKEAEHISSLTDAYTVDTCEEVLKADPHNKQAMETLERIRHKK